MSEKKHTLGPWVATRLLGSWWIEEDDDPTAFCQRRIAIVDDGAGTDSPEAIARLIAAAPELLAELETAKKFIEEHLPFGRYCTVEEYKSRVNKVMTPIEAAISKAKGTNHSENPNSSK